jgi:diaminohydroxyphosphoribosylaminopyrimidine deaminase / 5-amino-6-(5-phosphoribosylamino)uracil reductase
MFTEFDRLAMTRALALAERGLETTHPNPRVGCVIAKDNRIIAEGWHERAGEAHAEVAAIRSAKEPVVGATAYVTLEPCSHHGRTPPCVNALIEARIARVVFAVQDPNPRVSGQGADALLRAGITVEAGLMQAEATELNIGFMKRMREGLPWVRVKLAMSLDGRTALANGASQWITSESARADVQRWRARCSAVMTGVGTVLADDPQLNVRTPGFKGRQPLRVVLDARLRSPVGAKMFVGLGGDVLIFTAVGGGLSAAGATRSAAPVDPSTLAGDLAELVNAFETSPTSVAARSADLAGPVSVKSETPASLPAAGVAAPTAGAAGATVSAGAPIGAAPAESVGAGVAAANAGAAAASAPPILAAATSAGGVAPTADDATWAGAALSGAVPVKSESKTGTDGNGAAAVSDVSAPPSMYGSLAPPIAAASKAAPIVTGEGPTATPATAAAAPEPAGTKPTPATTANGSASTTPGPAPAAHGSAPLARAPASAGHGPAASGATAAPPAPPPASPALGASTPAAAGANQRPAAQVTAPAVKPTPKPDSPAAFQARRAALAARGVRIEEVAADEGFLDLFAVLKRLGELEVNEVLVEAGPTLAGQLLTTFFADELLLYIAPKLLGPQGRPLVNLPELQSLQDAWGFSLFDAKRFGDDLRLRMRPK